MRKAAITRKAASTNQGNPLSSSQPENRGLVRFESIERGGPGNSLVTGLAPKHRPRATPRAGWTVTPGVRRLAGEHG